MVRRSPIWAVLATLFSVIAVIGASLPDMMAQAGARPDSAPSVMRTGGEAGWRSGGPFGGVAQALALSPDFASDGLAFAGGWRDGPNGITGGYGIVKTTDRGVTWTPVFADAPWTQLAVLDLAISPGFATDGMAFAATEDGLLRTHDRGATWARLAGGLPGAGNDPAADDVARVYLAPNFAAEGTLLALMANGGLFISRDRGDTWANAPVAAVAAAAFSPGYATNGRLFAVVSGFVVSAQPNGGGAVGLQLARSTDRGASWQILQPLEGNRATDLLETGEGAVLVATEDGVTRVTLATASAARAAIPRMGAVRRMAAAGDHIYAAGADGLYISLSDGRDWQHYSDTPAIEFRAVAACPQWGRCHALMASSYLGVLGTPDDNLEPWRWLGGLRAVSAKAVAASPAYATDGTLFAATEDGLFRSTDRGLTWRLLTPGERPDHDSLFSQVRISAAYATDGTVFAAYGDRVNGRRGLYLSTDRGESWTPLFAPFALDYPMVLAVSPAYQTDRTIFVVQEDTLHKTTDGGATWRQIPIAPAGTYFTPMRLEVSPAYATDHTLFVSGWGGVRRSTDGGETWSTTGASAPSYGLAVSPSYAADRTLWHTFRAIEGAGDGTPDSAVRRSTDGGASWSWATAGLPGVYEPFPVPLAASPAYATDHTLFTALRGPLTAGSQRSLYRSLDGATTWQELGPAPGNLDSTDLAVSTEAFGRLTAHLATEAGVWHYSAQCEERVVNGGFEADFGWELPSTAYPASYDASQHHAGARSLRTGIVSGVDVYSYSTGRQVVTIPAGVESAVLNFWWYPVSAEPPAAVTANSGPSPDIAHALAQGGRPQGVQAGDWQYVLVYAADGTLLPPGLWTRSNAQAWQSGQLDLTLYRGSAITLTIGTFNDGDGRRSAMFVDDVALTACWPDAPWPTLTRTPSPTATQSATPGPSPTRLPMLPRVFIPLAIAGYDEPTPTPSDTATPTPSATGTRASTPTATMTPSATSTPAASPSATATPSHTPTATPSATGTRASTPTATMTPSITDTPTASPSAALTPSHTPTATPSATVTPSHTPTVTPSATGTPASTPTATMTPSVTSTPTATPSATASATRTPTLTPSATLASTSTATPTRPTATATASVTMTPTSTMTPMPGQACYEAAINGGFESDAGWTIRVNPVLAEYVTTPVHSGSRSMRTGIAAGSANVLSYSPIEQDFTFGAAATIQMRFWRYNVLEEGGSTTAALTGPDLSALPKTEAELLSAPLAGDFFYVIVIRDDNSLDWLLFEQIHNPAWRGSTPAIDLSRYAGQHIRVQFGTYNDGAGGISRTYLDDVSIQICALATPTPTATATWTATATPSRTPTATPTATGTVFPLESRWLRSLVAAPGQAGRLLGLTNQGYLMSSVDRGETWTTVALPAEVAGIPLSYRGFVGLDYIHPETIYLGGVSQGLWRSADGGATWSKRHTYPVGPVSVSFDAPDDLVAGLIGPNELNARIARSADGGLTWADAGSGSSGDVVSPILIDPQAHNLNYVITQGPRGGGTLYRTFDGNWEAILNAPLGLPPSGGPGLGLALDGGARGLYVASADGVLYVSGNAHTPALADITWTPVYAFTYGYLPIPLAVGGGPAGSALYVTVYDWNTANGRTLRSDDGGKTWRPLTLPAPAAPQTPTPTATRTATPTASVTPTAGATPTQTATVTGTPSQTPTATATPAGGFPAIVRELIAAPGAPGPLYALTNSELLLVSYDRGQSWQTAAQGTPPAVGRAGLGMDYANSSTLYLGTAAGLFRTDASGQWQFLHTVRTHALTVEYNRPTTLWAAVRQPNDFIRGTKVIKSDDGGQIWRSASDGLGGYGVSNPIIQDPDDPNTLYVMATEKYGGAILYRGVSSGNWRWLPAPAMAYLMNTGLIFDNGANALYVGGRNPGKLWRSLNANTANPDDVTWQVVHDFGVNKAVQPLAMGWGPGGPAIYLNLTDTGDWSTQLVRSDDGGSTWQTLSLPPGPPPPPSNQYQLIVNGYPATRLIADYRTQDRYATSFAGLHRKIGYNDWNLVNNAAPRPKFVYSPANSALIWAGLTPACLAGGPDEPMYKSDDGGRTWRELPGGRNIQPVVAHPTDPFKVYGFGCDGVYLTVDGGATWQHQDSDLWRLYSVSDVAAVDPGWTTIYASGVAEGGGGMLARSTDGGQSWQRVSPLAEDIWWITDVWVDPTNPNRVYFVEPKGVWRSLDGGATWQRFTAGLEDVLYQDGRVNYGLFEIVNRLDDPSRLYVGTQMGLYEGFDYGARWQKISGYSWDSQRVDGLLADGSTGVWLNSPDGAFYLYFGYTTPTPSPTPTTTSVPSPTGTPSQTPTPSRTPSATVTWTPTPTATATTSSTLTATPTATRTPTATTSPAPGQACYEAAVNGGFENDAGWTIRMNPALAEYVTAPVHSGARSMRTGIAASGANVTSYSPIQQDITFPALPFPGVSSTIQLSFWRYSIYEEGRAALASRTRVDPLMLPKTEVELLSTPMAGDFFYVIAILDDGALDWLFTEQTQAPTWRQVTPAIDLSRYAGQHIRLQIGTYNDGVGGISRTYLDDVSLQVCPPAGAFILPAGWPQRVIGRPESNTIYADVNGQLLRSDDAGRNWALAGVARPEHTILSADPNVLYAGDGYPCYMGGDPTAMWRTIDGGATWQALPAGQNLKPLAAHGADQRLYAAGCNGPYLSTNAGASFTRQADPWFGLYDVKAIAPVAPEWSEVWVGGVSEGGGGAVLVSRNGGANWALDYPNPGVVDIGWLGQVTLDRYRSGWIYAPAYNGFFYTPDDGANWINNSQGLEDVIGGVRPSGLYAVAQDPGDPAHQLYLGTRRGLYARDNATAIWYKLAGQPFDALEVTDLLVLDGLPARLYVTTQPGVFLYDLRQTSPATPTPTNSPTPTNTPGGPIATPTPTATPTASPTPSATPTAATTAVPTAEPGPWPTPWMIASLSLPAGSHPHGVALDATGAVAYVAFHGAEHTGRTLGVVNTNPLALSAQITLSADATGPNGVALIGASGLVAAANRETANVAVVNPTTRAVVGQIPAGLQPDGVIVQGGFGYIANFSDNTVTVFDATTRAVLGTLAVGAQPSLFAADPASNDVYLSLHGANEVLRLRDGAAVGAYTGITAPYGLAFDPTSRRLYVANRGSAHTVTVIDTAAGTTLGAIGLDREPFVLAVNPRTGHLYVARGDQVQVYRTLDWAPVTTITVPAGAEEGIALDALENVVYVTSAAGDALTAIQDVAPPLVLFGSDRDGNGELYRMLPDGREQIRLTFTSDVGEVSPAGSPDGKWIAYVRTGADGWQHLWLMNRDGHNARQLTFGSWDDVRPTWSGTGAQLAFASNRYGDWEILALRLADDSITRLTSDPAEDTNPDWSWATGRIAFQSNRVGPNGEIFSMAADGSDVQRLTTNINGDRGPVWSPDGGAVVFWGSRAEQTLYKMRADGADITQLISRTYRPESPAWGPGSAASWIVFTGYRPDSGHSEIFRMTPAGAEIVLLTQNEVNFDYSPGWLPGQLRFRP